MSITLPYKRSTVAMKVVFNFFPTLFILVFLTESLCADIEKDAPVTIPGIVKITATVRKTPPGWAIMQRQLMKTIEVFILP